MYNIMGKFAENFKKKGGFSGLGKKFSETGGRMAKFGGKVAKIGGLFSKDIAEFGDAIQVAGAGVSTIGSGIQTGVKLSEAVKKGDFEGAGKSAGEMVADAKKLKEDVEKGSKLKFMG